MAKGAIKGTKAGGRSSFTRKIKGKSGKSTVTRGGRKIGTVTKYGKGGKGGAAGGG